MTASGRASRSFCSNVNLELFPLEPILGTAHQATGFLLISWPRRLWGRQHFQSRGLPADLIAELKRIQKEHRHFVRLVSSGADEEGVRVFAMPSNHIGDFASIAQVAPFLRDTFGTPGAAPDFGSWTPRRGGLFLICTNGARDRCCAKHGFSVFKAAKAIRDAEDLDLEVLQCTHLTGDRFAACALSLPSGDLYGRLRSENVAACIKDVVAGTVHHALFRGNSYLSEPDQVIDGLICQRFGGRPARVTSTVSPHDGRFDVTIHEGETRRVVGRARLERRIFELPVDCADLDQGKRDLVPRLVVTHEEWCDEGGV